jgi:hypothetical protein
MKYRWRRFMLTSAIILLALALIGVGTAVWLHQSGRLATFATELIQYLSEQDITIGAVSVTSWNRIVLTDVQMSQRLPGWRLTLYGPRLEIHYGLTGLLRKQIDTLAISQPQLDLSYSPDAAPPPASQSSGVLPLKRLIMQQGTLRLHWRNHTYTIQQLEAHLRPLPHHQIRAEANGILDDHAAPLQLNADIALDGPQPTGHVRLTTASAPLARLAKILTQELPVAWEVRRGKLDLELDLQIRATALQATMQIRDVSVQQATLSTKATITADRAKSTFHLQGHVDLQTTQRIKTSDMTFTKVTALTDINLDVNPVKQSLQASGQARLQAEKLHAKTSDLLLAKVSLSAPWRLSYTPDDWQINATPTVQSQTAKLGTAVQASQLSLSTRTPVQIQPGANEKLQMQATPELRIQSLQTDWIEPPLRITELQARFPLQSHGMRLNVTNASVQTQAWEQQAATAAPLLEALTLTGSGSLNLQHQQLTLRDATATLPQLGRMSGNGRWNWSSHTLHDIQVKLTPNTLAALQAYFKPVLPVAYQDWLMSGQTELDLRAPHIALRSPRHIQELIIDWQLRDGAFSSPDSTYAGEHLNGNMQASVNFDRAADQYRLQGAFTLSPFALLVGTFFPALEDNHISTRLTFTSDYSHHADRLNIQIAGHLHDLADVTLQGVVYQPRTAPRYDLQIELHDLRSARFWKTFVHDPIQFPTLSQAMVQGTLNATLHVSKQSSGLHFDGKLDLTEGRLEMERSSLTGVALSLPVQGQYPWPQTAPAMQSLPTDAYGQLSIETLQIGGLTLEHLNTRLAVASDNMIFQPSINLSLWDGQFTVKHLIAQHLLQSHRQLTWQTQLHGLNLQHLQRGATKLPLAGVINGNFPSLRILDNKLETRGSLNISVANGMIRLFDLQGSDLFSTLPSLRFSMVTEQPLSLLQLTHIYPIGGIGGTLHFTLTDMALTAGEPAAFSLDFAVQEKGGEERQITLRALNNLLFTTGSTKVASGVIGDTHHLPYKYFGVRATLQQDTLQLRGKYHDRKGNEYFMRAPALGGGVSIINRVPGNGIPFQDFLQRLKATVLEKPEVRLK